jgi:hypothetical protein
MSDEALYRYRMFTSFGITLSIFSPVDSREKLWSKIVNSTDEEFEGDLFKVGDSAGNLSGLSIRPSAITGLDTPYGTEPVSSTQPQPIRRNPPKRRNRVTLETTAGSRKKGSVRRELKTKKVKR